HYIFIQRLNKHLLTDVFLLCTNECFAYMLILYLAQFVSQGIDIMGYITKRGASYLAQVSIHKNGKSNRLTKTFKRKSDAKRWVLENELSKANGKDLANTLTSFAEFFENWVYLIKRNDVKETTFQN